jgi:hypothetical protein
MKNRFTSILDLLEPADRIVVPKSGIKLIQHHAIYTGFRLGHHWFLENKDFIGVREVMADVFFQDVQEVTRVEPYSNAHRVSREQAVAYGRSLIGRNYNLAFFNCEHLANAVQKGRPESKQVQNAVLGTGLLVVGAGIMATIFGGRK